LILGSLSYDPRGGLVGILVHVDSLEMLVERASHKLLMLESVPPKSELRGCGTRRAMPGKNFVIGPEFDNQLRFFHDPQFPTARSRLLAPVDFKLHRYRIVDVRTEGVLHRFQICLEVFCPSRATSAH
jgi:hypothetical protein